MIAPEISKDGIKYIKGSSGESFPATLSHFVPESKCVATVQIFLLFYILVVSYVALPSLYNKHN